LAAAKAGPVDVHQGLGRATGRCPRHGEWRLDLLDTSDRRHDAPRPARTQRGRRTSTHNGTTVAGVAEVLPSRGARPHRHRDRTGRGGPSRGSPNSPPGTSPRHTRRRSPDETGMGCHATVFPPHNPARRPRSGRAVAIHPLRIEGPGTAPRLLDPVTVFFTSRGLGSPTCTAAAPRASADLPRTRLRTVGVADVEDLRRGRLPPHRGVERRPGAGWWSGGQRRGSHGPRDHRELRRVRRSDRLRRDHRHDRAGRSTPAWRRAAPARDRCRLHVAAHARLAAPGTPAGPDLPRRGRPAGPDRARPKLLRDALQENRVPHAYLVFKGEGHAVGAESVSGPSTPSMSFYGQVLGFEPRRDPSAPPHRRIARAGVSPGQLAPSRRR